jgi:hypothetical protein
MEIKQLDASRFERIGDQLFASYDGDKSRRSCSDQVRDAALGLKKIAAGSGYPSLFVYALAWLTELDRDALRDADPIFIGRDASLRDMLLAAAAQNRSLAVADDATSAAVRAVRTRLTNRPS